ncbi:MAG: tetratricopeptide repeat protein [Candidatus Zixiibacteriota bacterium]
MNIRIWIIRACAGGLLLASAGCVWIIGGDEHKRKQSISKHTNMAEIHELAGNYEGAVDEYRAVIELAPDLAEAYMGLGNNLNKLERYEEAAEAYRRATDLDPRNYSYQFNLGVTLARSEKFSEAAEELRRAAALAPNKAEAYVYLGSALRSAGEYADAAAALARALVIEPDNTLAHLNLALTLDEVDAARARDEWIMVRDARDAPAEWREMAEERLAAEPEGKP